MADDRITNLNPPGTPVPATNPNHNDTFASAAPAPAAAPASAAPEPKAPSGIGRLWALVFPPPGPTIRRGDGTREIVETIVFVVVLVLMLKSFVAEAFVIPTGSMAETLYGYQLNVVCPECDYHFPVNCSQEVEGRDGRTSPVTGCTCPNCRVKISWNEEKARTKPDWKNGDRVLVAKYLYDTGLKEIMPFDVVVFKFPEQPQKDFTPMNYIKRLIGKPGQTVGIHYGDLYIADGGIDYGQTVGDSDLPLRRQTYRSDSRAQNLLRDRGPNGSPFHILRKPPDKMLALRRMVYDNDHQPKDLKGKNAQRWIADQADVSWKPEDAEQPKKFRHEQGGETMSWLRYRHLMRNDKVELITDMMGYNTAEPEQGGDYQNWVPDLMLEFHVTIQDASDGELTLDLAKGEDRFQARWQLATGTCTLVRIGRGGKETELAKQETALKKSGEYRIRFANFDERLTVWVDNSLPFGDGVNYEPPIERSPDGLLRYKHGPDEINDLQPAKIGVRRAALSVHSVKLWRDTYYTNWREDGTGVAQDNSVWSTPSEFMSRFRNLNPTTLYVQPRHYLCLGDNSPASSDSRSWGKNGRGLGVDDRGGLVPEELMLGRALMVYFPFNRFGPIR